MSTSGKLREEGFLEQCFLLLSKFSHDKLKELVEKEKEDSKTNTSLLWSLFLHLMLTFADLEKNFYSLVFIGPSSFGSRWLTKKETTLKMRYSCLLTELRKIETAHKDQTLLPTNTDSESSCFQNLEQLVGIIGGQLQHFVVTRMNIIEFYEQFPALAINRNVCVEDLHKIINSNLEEFLSKFYQPIVSGFKDTYKMECEVIIHLLKFQMHLQKCQYMESLMSFVEANKHLDAWYSIINSKEVKKLTFGNSANKTSTPELLEWLTKLRGFLLSKFNFYFFDVLCQIGGNPPEVRTIVAKAPIDFYSRITSFYKKADAYKILLVVTEVDESDESSRKQGYYLPSRAALFLGSSSSEGDNSLSSSLQAKSPPLEPPEFISCPDKVVIFEYPQDKHDRHDKHQPASIQISTVYRLLDTNNCELEQPEKITSTFSVETQCTYVITRIEGAIHLVTILNKRNYKLDTYVTNFYNSLASDVKCNKLFLALKQGSK